MYLSVVTFPMDSGAEPDAWIRERQEEARSARGVQRVEFVRGFEDPGVVGMLMRFGSKEDLDRFRSSDAYREMIEDVRSRWLRKEGALRQGHYEILEA